MADVESARLTADEIFERVIVDAESEIGRPPRRLAISALFAGLVMGLSALGVAAADAALGPGHLAVSALLYPLGFIAVILGRSQLFTENTLYPVALSLRDHAALRPTVRLWSIVLIANLIGAALFALLATRTGGLSSSVVEHLRELGVKTAADDWDQNFWSAVLAGFIIALVAWTINADDRMSSQFLVIFAFTYVVGLASLDHCIASAVEVLSAVFSGDISVGRLAGWLSAAVVGNAAGGVLIVTVLNYGQVRNG